MFDTPILPRLDELIVQVRQGHIGIPEFQRAYVWDDDQRLRLLDSIWRGIPIGSLLVWRTSQAGPKTTDRIGPHHLPQAKPAVKGYLVDGLQRLTTLFAALTPLPEGEERDADGRRWPIYFDLDDEQAGDQRFRLRKGNQDPPPTWLPLSCLFDDDQFLAFRERLRANRPALLDEARRVESRFRGYIIPMVFLVTDDANIATEAFARVNTEGRRLDEGDMAHALSLFGGFNLNDGVKSVQEELAPLGWGAVERQVLLNALKAIWNIDVYKAGAKGITEHLTAKSGQEDVARLPQLFAPAARLLGGFGVRGPGSLPYSLQLVALLYLVHKLGEGPVLGAQTSLRQWFYWTTYNEHFTGMTSQGFDAELTRLEGLVRGAPLDWIDAPRVTRLDKLNPNSVRSRVAILVMAIAGDQEEGGSVCAERYGRDGTDALHQLYPSWPRTLLANRVLASENELRRLRTLVRVGAQRSLPLLGEPGGMGEVDEAHLRRHLIVLPAAPIDPAPDAMLADRAARLAAIERAFVEEIGGIWREGDESP
jgi:hypothetical protein